MTLPAAHILQPLLKKSPVGLAIAQTVRTVGQIEITVEKHCPG